MKILLAEFQEQLTGRGHVPSAVIGQIDRPLQDRKGQRDTDNIIGEYGAERDFRQNRHPHIALQQTLIGGAVVTLRDDIWSKARLQAVNKPQSELYTCFMESAEALDDSTVKVNLLYKEPAALQYLTQTNSAIVSKAYVESVGDENYAASPCGTGPYKLVEWQKGSKIILEANEDYYKGAPSIKNIELRVLKETTTSMVALESGDVDLVYNIGGLDTLAVQSNEDLGYQETVGTSIWNLGFNVNQAPFDNPQVRRALAMAVNREDIINGAMDGAGTPAEIILTEQTLPNPGADVIDTPPFRIPI